MVTADGRQVIASETSHPDLFWAVRGGGGNFGVVTRFQYKLYRSVRSSAARCSCRRPREALRALVPVASSAPEELTTISFLMGMPPAPVHPRRPRRSSSRSSSCSCGAATRPTARPRSRRSARSRRRSSSWACRCRTWASTSSPRKAEKRTLAVHRSRFLDGLDDAAVDAILTPRRRPTSPMTMIQLRVLGGAVGRVARRCDRLRPSRGGRSWSSIVTVRGSGQRADPRAWTASLFDALAPNAAGVYSNFLEAEGQVGSTRPIPAARTSGSPRSSGATTHRTSSTRTRTSGRRSPWAELALSSIHAHEAASSGAAPFGCPSRGYRFHVL